MSQVPFPLSGDFTSMPPQQPKPQQVQASLCPRCGSLVGNPNVHNIFHGAILTKGLLPGETMPEVPKK